MSQKPETDNIIYATIVIGLGVLMLHLYYFCHPLLHSLGWTAQFADTIVLSLRGFFVKPLQTKLFALALFALGCMVRTGRSTELDWWKIIVLGAAGLLLYLIPVVRDMRAFYLFSTVTGLLLFLWAVTLGARKVDGVEDDFDELNDPNETFRQCEKLIETPTSVNLPTRFQWQGRIHKGWINVVNPFRAVMILGTPGSGKSFSVYNPFIEQMVAKGYTGIMYDYKYPDLTNIVFNELRLNLEMDPRTGQMRYKNPAMRKYPVPEFYVLNFTDAQKSNRCNPLKAEYFPDVADATDVAEVLFKNVSRESGNGGDKFFVDSAKEYIGCIIYFLAQYENLEHGIRKGDLCSIPHFVELISKDYKRVFKMLMNVKEIENKMQPFIDAFEADSQDQLQGQIASARIPMNKLASPDLYWILSGDDFTLDVNNPEHPKIVCIGNDPLRDEVYGPSLALFTSRIFKEVYKPKKKGRPCFVLLDEMPTIYLKDVDKIIATARSYKVAMVMGAQDKSQLIRDYRKEYANVLFNTVGTIISGQVNGDTANDLSRMMGKEKRRQRSQTKSNNGDSFNYSYHDVELMPASRIETLSQGFFLGKVADDFSAKIDIKRFAGEIQRDVDKWEYKVDNLYEDLPRITSFGEEEIWENLQSEDVRTRILEDYAIQILQDDEEFAGMSPEEQDAVYNEKIDRIVAGFSKEDKEEFINDAYEKLCEQTRETKKMDNFFKIKDEINMLLDIESPLESEEEDDPMDQ